MELEDLDQDEYDKLAVDSFDFLASLVRELLPVLWANETTIRQGVVSTLVLTKQLEGKPSKDF